MSSGEATGAPKPHRGIAMTRRKQKKQRGLSNAQAGPTVIEPIVRNPRKDTGLLNDSGNEHHLPNDVGAILHLLDTNPTVFERLIEPRLRRQYQEALEALCAEMKNLHRERAVVSQRIIKLVTSGRPAPEHIPTLAELERIARQVGGTAYVHVEETVFSEMARLSHPDLIPFLVEAFQYHRHHDQFAARRREYAVDIAAVIAARTGVPQAITALGEMLADPTPRTRGVALVIIYEAYEREGCDMPSSLLAHFWQLARSDPDRRVRQTALACLQRLGQIS